MEIGEGMEEGRRKIRCGHQLAAGERRVQERGSIISSSNACAMTVRLAASCYVFGVFVYGIFLLHHFSHEIARCALLFYAPSTSAFTATAKSRQLCCCALSFTCWFRTPQLLSQKNSRSSGVHCVVIVKSSP